MAEWTEYPGIRIMWLDDEARRLFESEPKDHLINGSSPDTSATYFLDLIARIDDATGDRRLP